MREIEGILFTALIISILRGQAYKVSLKALGNYMRKKGYTLPTDNELKECSRIALKEVFKAKERE